MWIALVNTNRKTETPPIALLKLATFLKNRGDEVELYDNRLPEKADEIWLTTVFTFDIPYARGMIKEAKNRASIVKIGGVSASLLPDKFSDLDIDIHIGLHPEAEYCKPDYSLIKRELPYNVVHTSRGCVRKCKFCSVPKIEPEFISKSWVDTLSSKSKKINFFDNNWLAKPEKDWLKDVEILHALVKSKRITQLDFNQGLDARLLTREKAKVLRGLPITPVRFAFDNMATDGKYQKAIELMIDQGFKNFLAYVLYNFKDTPADFYYRLRESVRLKIKHGVNVNSFPMRYQPVLTVNPGRNYAGTHWKAKQVHAFIEMTVKSTGLGLVSPNSVEEFEFWYGKDEKEFVKLLNYPKINLLLRRKKMFVRHNKLFPGK